MQKVKCRTFSGAVCEQEVFNIADNKKNIKTAEPQERFKNEEERDKHKLMMSRRHHERVINATFSAKSLYSTLTLDNDYEVHTFKEARMLRDRYIRRLKRFNPEAQICIYMGRGKATKRIHFHMLSNGLEEKAITDKWQYGAVLRVEKLKEHNYYNGVDHGQDYKGLANYLFDHWTPEQGKGSHRWKQTKNICQPEREEPTIAKRNYSESKPPRAPKGYKLVEYQSNQYGYQYFKYVKEVAEAVPSKVKRR